MTSNTHSGAGESQATGLDLASPSAFPDLGERFEVLEFIGQGGMGIVYKVKDKSINQILAVKVLNEQFAKDPIGIKRFESEAKASCQLTHANLVTVYDYCRTTNGVPFIVMDFLDGKTLADLLKESAYLSVPIALDIFYQVADALAGIHAKGIIHRDLKPTNILLLPTEIGYMVKVVDFGIAKVLPEMTNYATTVAQTGEIIGSPLYMSPEQCQGEKVDVRSDIYSFGCVMYEALSGVNPFMAENQIKIILAQISTTPRPFKHAQDIPDCLEALIFKCLKKNPNQRYQSAAELLKDLESMRDGNSVTIVAEGGSELEVLPQSTAIGYAQNPTATPALKKQLLIAVSVLFILMVCASYFASADHLYPIMLIVYGLIAGAVLILSGLVKGVLNRPGDEQRLESTLNIDEAKQRTAKALLEPIELEGVKRYWSGSQVLLSDDQRLVIQSKIFYSAHVSHQTGVSRDDLHSVTLNIDMRAGEKTQIKLTFDSSDRASFRTQNIISETTGRISKAICLGALGVNQEPS